MVLSILWVDTSTTFAMLWNLWTPIPQPPLSCICLWILLMPFPLPNQCRHHIKSATPSSSRNSTPPLNWRDRTLRESGGGRRRRRLCQEIPFLRGISDWAVLRSVGRTADVICIARGNQEMVAECKVGRASKQVVRVCGGELFPPDK